MDGLESLLDGDDDDNDDNVEDVTNGDLPFTVL
jgi:hypothetical protein